MILRPTVSTFFPYTTLFRSRGGSRGAGWERARVGGARAHRPGACRRVRHRTRHGGGHLRRCAGGGHRPSRRVRSRQRSEEHTSELQSRENLVCRLLLEKKNK